MSHIRVKTTYSVQGNYGDTEIEELYCHHNLSSDTVTFYNKNGKIAEMCFESWQQGNDLWDAMNRLYYPFKTDELQPSLVEGVEYYINIGD